MISHTFLTGQSPLPPAIRLQYPWDKGAVVGGWRVCLDPSAHAADYGQEVRVQKVSGRAGCISNSPLVSESCAVPCAFSLLKSTLSRGWSFQDKPGWGPACPPLTSDAQRLRRHFGVACCWETGLWSAVSSRQPRDFQKSTCH